jgi:8-oxo-dGTP diphosphatase
MAQHKVVRRAAGAVVYRVHNNTPEILLILDQYQRWTLPKGHLDPGETEEQAAVREVLEETSVQGELGDLVERISYTVFNRGNPQGKQVAFFLMNADSEQLVPQSEEGISAAEWIAPSEALDKIGYPQVRSVVERAIPMISQALNGIN